MLAAGVLSAAEAEQQAYYLDLNAHAGAVAVELNGFPLYEALHKDSRASSLFISPYLRNGENVLEVAFDSLAGAEISWLEFEVASADVTEPKRTDENETDILSRRLEPVGQTSIGIISSGDAIALGGSVSPDNQALGFANTAHRRWVWGAKLTEPDNLVRGMPVRVQTKGLNATLAQAEIHFLNSENHRHVTFKGLKLPRGGESVKLDRAHVVKGARWLDEGGFDTVWVFGFAAEGVAEVESAGLTVHWQEPKQRLTERFEIDLPRRWSWQEGAEVSEALKDDDLRAALVEHLRVLHQTLDKRPATEWSPFFERKLLDLAAASGRAPEEMRKGQVEFFESLAATEGWALEPFDEHRLQLVPVNDRVVRVTYVDSEGPLHSVPIKPPGRDQLDRFSIPLYVSLIDDQWTVVR